MKKVGWLVLGAIAIAGCGGGHDTTVVAGDQPAAPASDSGANRKAPPASGGDAREEGRNACRGLSPLQAANRFEEAALEAGVRRHFAELVASPTPATETSPGYPRLVAALYATTVRPDRQAQAAAGCAEELAAHTGVEKDPSDRTG